MILLFLLMALSRSIKHINKESKYVLFDDDEKLTVDSYRDAFVKHFDKRIAGETLLPADMERFMNRSSAKNLKQLLDVKKAEGVIEGSMGKKLSPGMKIALMSIVIIVIVMLVVLYMAKSMGFLPI